MDYRLKVQGQYYLYLALLGLAVTLVYALIFSMTYLEIVIVSFCICITTLLFIRALVNEMKICLTQEAIMISYPFGIMKQINYCEVYEIKQTNKGVSLYALSRSKVLIVWKKGEQAKAVNVLLSPVNIDEFIETVKQRISAKDLPPL